MSPISNALFALLLINASWAFVPPSLRSDLIGNNVPDVLFATPSDGQDGVEGWDTSNKIDRRDAFLRAGLVAASSVLLGGLAATPSAAAADTSAFVGTYSDPINHPGGKRTIKLVEGGKVGDYQLAEVQGGGGVGEPKNYILPALILGDRAIIIDFSPKGGPRDFTGVLDGKDIKFLKDGNRWPRIG